MYIKQEILFWESFIKGGKKMYIFNFTLYRLYDKLEQLSTIFYILI